MPDPITLDQVQAILNPEQRAFLDSHIQTTTQAAIDKFKTDADEARKKAIPETYQLKFSDGTPLDPQADKDKIVAHLKAHGFSNEQAQAHLQFLDETARVVATRTEKAHEAKLAAEQTARIDQMAQQFKTELAADPDVGGARLVMARADAQRAYNWLAGRSPALKKAVERLQADIGSTLYNDYQPLIAIFAEFGKATREPEIIAGSASGKKGPKDLKEALYGVKTG